MIAIIPIRLNNDWNELLSAEMNKAYFKKLLCSLEFAYEHHIIYPPQSDLLNAFNWTAYKEVKVVILGQDPYHGPHQAHGLSFSVMPGEKIPPSLRNIFKELQSDLNCFIPNNGYLKHWADQGVLLLNSVLSVQEGLPQSHKDIGWTEFTNFVIELLNARQKPMVFLLWGKPAQEKARLIDPTKHLILKAPHPSPLSASKGFLGCSHFSKCNDYLEQISVDAIDWQIPNI